MSGLVAIYLVMCPVYDTAHCVIRDPNMQVERKMCGVRFRANDLAHNQSGVVTIKCKR